MKLVNWILLSCLLTVSSQTFANETNLSLKRSELFLVKSKEADGLNKEKGDIGLKLNAGFPDGNGPFPVVVILHGSGNMNKRDFELGKILVKHDIAWLGVQSYDSRGLKFTKYFSRLMKANIFDQINDAYAALNFINEHPDLDVNRVSLTGFSLGGTSASIIASGFQKEKANGLKFKYILSLYGGCLYKNQNKLNNVKIDFIWGANDQSTPKFYCDQMRESFKSNGAEVSSYYLDNTNHGWFSRKSTVSKSSFQGCFANIKNNTLTIENGVKTLSLQSPTDSKAMKSFAKMCQKNISYRIEANTEAELFSANLLITNTLQ